MSLKFFQLKESFWVSAALSNVHDSKISTRNCYSHFSSQLCQLLQKGNGAKRWHIVVVPLNQRSCYDILLSQNHMYITYTYFVSLSNPLRVSHNHHLLVIVMGNCFYITDTWGTWIAMTSRLSHNVQIGQKSTCLNGLSFITHCGRNTRNCA